MDSYPPAIFSPPFPRAPDAVQHFLHAALRLSDVEQLYSDARRAGGDSLSGATLALLGARIAVEPADLARVPKSGPLIVVANHPFGLLDGLVLDSLLSRIRPDYKILTNAMLCAIREIRDHTIPVDVFGGENSGKRNVRAARAAIDWLHAGHCIAMFPAGEVSHWRQREKRIADPPWSQLAARFAASTGSPTVPVYFHGANSLTFQIAGALHPRLRTVRLPAELLNKQGRSVTVRIGGVIPAADLKEAGDPEQATAYLRARTYWLGLRERPAQQIRPRVFPLPISRAESEAPRPVDGSFQHEIDRLIADGNCVVSTDTYDVYLARSLAAPGLLREVGRLREITFRAAGEGTGKALDLDRFDEHYTHLILWNKADRAVAGAYRLAWTNDVLPAYGPKGLYTSTLFRYSPEFFTRLGGAVELGRSFVRGEYQKQFAPLFLLWQAIARCVLRRPDSPLLFGPVSISNEYSAASREMIVNFLRAQRYRGDLAPLVSPRRPFRCRLTSQSELLTIARTLHNVEDLNAPIHDLDSHPGVPVLLRQYLKMGGRVAAFNVDRKFSNSLDGLLVVDLREAPDKLLARYAGGEELAAAIAALRAGVPPLRQSPDAI